ncbi:MAG: (d)CMP kinase [Dehalococcoidia bacterium]|jgi:cytidylate kinase|nr:(d)CMP kinase [Dehalococcoidia bacterium]
MIITIDGPAGVGKTTVGKLTANKLGIGFLDTGIMYRALTWSLLKNNLEDSSIDKILIHLKNLTFDLDIRNVDTTTIFINKINVTDLLNSPQVEEYVSKISSFREVREIMVIKQRDIVKNTSSLVVGRDIGTIVLPNAKSKFYLTASAEERAKRRFSQKSEKISYSKVLKDIIERDKLDMSRKFSPLKIPQNALIINTEKKNIHQVSDEIIKKI